MESLALGLTAICILFLILFSWAYWPDQWGTDQKKSSRLIRLRKAFAPALRKLTEYARNDHGNAKNAV